MEPFEEAEARAFEELIGRITNQPVLALPRSEFLYSLETDASEKQIGAALFREEKALGSKRQQICLWSRSLNDAEKQYSTPDKDCFAIDCSLTILRRFLKGSKFQLNTDPSSLRWLVSTTNGAGRVIRSRVRLSEYDLEAHYKEGIENSVAHCLSRVPRENGVKAKSKKESPASQ